MNKNMKYGIIIIVLVLAIGFAAVATNIIVNGNVQLGFKSSDYDIYFSRALPEDDGTATIDPTTKKSITYSTKTLTNVGDQAVLDYVVTNASTQYDARCTVEFEIDSGASEYVTITKTGFSEDAPTIVNAQSNQSGRVIITLKKKSMEAIHLSFTITLNFEPVGKTEPGEEGNVPGSDEEPDEEECVPSGYYELRCSCDNHTIAWLGGPYLDAQGNAMNANRTRDINYPPANTYICGCDGGTTGYVVNTGVLLESECPAPQPIVLGSHQNLLVKFDNRPTYAYYSDYSLKQHYDLTIPAFDYETGATFKQDVTMDIYNQVKDTYVELIEVDDEYQPINGSNVIQYDSLKKNRYRYTITLTGNGEDEYYYQVILRNKSDDSIYSSIEFIEFYMTTSNPYDYDDLDGHTYPYRQGKKAWATWFMNEGRNDVCTDVEECSS